MDRHNYIVGCYRPQTCWLRNAPTNCVLDPLTSASYTNDLVVLMGTTPSDISGSSLLIRCHCIGEKQGDDRKVL